MPDISMCNGVDCLVKDKCYRHIAKPSEYWQSFFPFYQSDTFKPETGCGDFIEVKRLHAKQNHQAASKTEKS